MRKSSGKLTYNSVVCIGQCWYKGFAVRGGGGTEGKLECWDTTTSGGVLVEDFTLGAAVKNSYRDIPDPGVFCASGLCAVVSGGVDSAIVYYESNTLQSGNWGING
ncbi:MAG: hypothetical protein KKD77_20790 [Gammaproteobacteria bacterium]|nr:hypothetical protein [Gammaproteobacteria bacterium]